MKTHFLRNKIHHESVPTGIHINTEQEGKNNCLHEPQPIDLTRASMQEPSLLLILLFSSFVVVE